MKLILLSSFLMLFLASACKKPSQKTGDDAKNEMPRVLPMDHGSVKTDCEILTVKEKKGGTACQIKLTKILGVGASTPPLGVDKQLDVWFQHRVVDTYRQEIEKPDYSLQQGKKLQVTLHCDLNMDKTYTWTVQKIHP